MGTRLLGWIFQWIKMGFGGRSWKKETGMVGKDGQSALDPLSIEVSYAPSPRQ
jgi:hypothetical protein